MFCKINVTSDNCNVKILQSVYELGVWIHRDCKQI